MMIPTLTPEKRANLYRSVQFIAVLAEMMKMEYLSELVDGRFKNPQVNQFAGRIRKDADAILLHMKHNEKVMIAFQDPEFIEQYAGELYRVFHFFIGLELDQIKEVMDNLYQVAKEVEA